MKLNQEQTNIVKRPLGHDIILSGPGSGKTTTLSHRIIYLIKSLQVKPSSIVVLSYTIEAAKNIINRTAELGLTKEEKSDILSGTIHSFCLKQLLEYTGKLENYKVLATKQDIARFQYDFIDNIKNDKYKDILEPTDWDFLKTFINDSINSTLNNKNFSSDRNIQELVNTLKFSGLINSILDNSQSIIEHVETGNREEDRNSLRVAIALSNQISNSTTYKKLTDLVLQIMINEGIYTYDTMISSYHKLIHDPENKDYFTDMKSPIFYVAIDEFQDLEPRQFEIVDRLSSNIKGSMLIGDIWQSIYQFKLSLPAYINIKPFTNNDPFVQLINSEKYNIIPLIHSFRSTKLNTLLANKSRENLYTKFFKGKLTEKIEISKKVISVSKEIGNKPKVIYNYEYTEQAIYNVLDIIKKEESKSNCILFRTNNEMRKAVDMIKRSGKKSTVEFVNLLKYKEFLIAKILFNTMIESGKYNDNDMIRILTKGANQNLNYTSITSLSPPCKYPLTINSPLSKCLMYLLSLYLQKPINTIKTTFEPIILSINHSKPLDNQTILDRISQYTDGRYGVNNQALHIITNNLIDLWNETYIELLKFLTKETSIDKILNFFIYTATKSTLIDKTNILSKDIKDFIKSTLISTATLEFSGKNLFKGGKSFGESMYVKRIDKPYKTGYYILNTMHKAKGLEWDNVHLIMPVYIASRIMGNSEQNKYEEFLEYVSFTRAKKNISIHLYNSISSATQGIQNYLPTRNIGNPVFFNLTKHLATKVSLDNTNETLKSQYKLVNDKDIKELKNIQKYVDFIQFTPSKKTNKIIEENI